MTLARWDIHHHSFRVEADGRLAERVGAVLHHLGARPADGPADLELRVGVGDAVPPASDARPSGRHLDVQVLRDALGIVLAAPSGTARIAADGLASRIDLAADALPLHLLTHVVVHQLRLRGSYTLHAAAVSRGRGALVVVGDSGTGKSTLALALARQGWGLLSDDSVLLSAGPEVLALRRGVFVEPGPAATAFPDLVLRPCPLVEASKQEVALPGGQVERDRPAALLLPEIGGGDETALEPAAPLDALYHLARQSRLPELDHDGAQDHFEVLGAVAAAVPAYRLVLGRDVYGAPERVSARLGALA